MALIGQRYTADLALRLIGGNFTMHPTDAAWAIKNLRKPNAVIPMHYGSNLLTKGTAAQFIAAMGNSTVNVVVATRGQALSFSPFHSVSAGASSGPVQPLHCMPTPERKTP